MITLEHAKAYLRVDSTYEEALITALLASAESICEDVARLTAEEWAAVYAGSEDTVTIRGEEYSEFETECLRHLLDVAILYTVGYLYEHREEADHHDMLLTLRNLLFAVREGVM